MYHRLFLLLSFHHSQLMQCSLTLIVNQRIVNRMSVTSMLNGEIMTNLWTSGWREMQVVGLPWDYLVPTPL